MSINSQNYVWSVARDSTQPSRDNFAFGYCLLISALIALTNWFLLPLPRVLAGNNWSSERIGWTMAMFLGAWTIAQLVSGMISQLIGSRNLALLGSILGVFGGFCYISFSVMPYAILPARILHGIGSAFAYSGVLYLFLDRLPMRLRAKAIGYYGLPGVAMAMVGPAIAENLERNWGILPVVTLVLLVFCVLFIGILKFNEIPRRESESATPIVGHFGEIVSRGYGAFMVFMVLGACSSVWQTFLAPLVIGLGPGALSSFAIGHGSGAVLSRLSASSRVDHGRPRLAAILALIVYGGGLALIPKAYFGWQLATLGLVTGVTYGLAFVAIISLAIERMLPDETSVGTAFLLASIGLGGFFGPPIWGVIADNFGYDTAFVLAGSVLAVSVAVFVIGELVPGTAP